VLVAHSLLGTFAARFAARNSGLLRHLVICGSPGVGPYRMPPGLLLAAVLMGIRPSERGLKRFARWPFHDLARTRQRDPHWFDLFFAYTLERARAPHVQRTMRRLISLYTKQIPLTDLRTVTVRTTLVWGARDRMVPLRVGETAAANLDWPLRVLPDVGHVPSMENPAGFVATIEEILAEVDGGR
jgi:2-hydroxymuconate-semialdehyde hydrolase